MLPRRRDDGRISAREARRRRGHWSSQRTTTSATRAGGRPPASASHHTRLGPDEFHSGYPDRPYDGIDNNAYTNVMAVWVILRAPAEPA